MKLRLDIKKKLTEPDGRIKVSLLSIAKVWQPFTDKKCLCGSVAIQVGVYETPVEPKIKEGHLRRQAHFVVAGSPIMVLTTDPEIVSPS